MVTDVTELIQDKKYLEFHNFLESLLYRDLSIKDSTKMLLYLQDCKEKDLKTEIKKYILGNFPFLHADKILNIHIDEELNNII